MSYDRDIAITFAHCDPAGIVFYPRYFEMMNGVIEAFFGEALDYSFARIHMDEDCGVPTVRTEVNFHAPSRLGEVVRFRLNILRIGTSSIAFRITAVHGGELRLTADLTLVWVGPAKQAEPWPKVLRERMQNFWREGQAG